MKTLIVSLVLAAMRYHDGFLKSDCFSSFIPRAPLDLLCLLDASAPSSGVHRGT